ncbi:MAG: nitroreductase family protein [Candidatus Omnitrophota bacterium]
MPTIYGKKVEIIVNDQCNLCGLCVEGCPTAYLELESVKVRGGKKDSWGCLTCGHCAAICPVEAIHVEAEGIGRQDVLRFSKEKPPTYDALFRLLVSRRSVRKFSDQPVSRDITEKILEAAQQAPAGLPPSTVKVVVLDGKEAVRSFAFDFLDAVRKMSWLFSKAGVWLLRPFMSKEEHRSMRELVVPIYKELTHGRAQGKDLMFYDAPLAMIFACSEDPADAGIACTYAMIAAESLGLGSCMIGTVVPMLAHTSREFRERYKIAPGMRHGLAIIFGHAAGTFERGIRRRFAGISFVDRPPNTCCC